MLSVGIRVHMQGFIQLHANSSPTLKSEVGFLTLQINENVPHLINMKIHKIIWVRSSILHSLTTVLETPVQMLILALFQWTNHMAAGQCLNPCRYRSRASLIKAKQWCKWMAWNTKSTPAPWVKTSCWLERSEDNGQTLLMWQEGYSNSNVSYYLREL